MESVLNVRSMSFASHTECAVGLGYVGDERCAKPYDKRSVRGVISLSGRGTSEMLNGYAAGGTSPTYTAWAESGSPRTLRLSWGFTYSPSPMVSDYGMLMGESSNILTSARGYKGVSFNPYLFGSKEYLTTGSANLLDFTARTYDPTTLLSQTQDPKATDYTSLNSYLYCVSDPINRVNWNGMAIEFAGSVPTEYEQQD